MEIKADDYLKHYGTKGMRWGVRKDDHPGASRSTNKEARKDAEEFSKAKLFYGEGAGTRRKLIKATVESKANKDSTYKEAFDHHLSRQDLGKRASQARSERRRKDTVKTTTKTAKGVHRKLTGGFGNVSLASAVLAGGLVYARSSGADKVIADTLRTTVNNARNNRSNMNAAQQYLRDMGL